MRLGQRTRMLLSLRRPQGGACCGLSSLRLSSDFPGSWQPEPLLPLPPQTEPLQEYWSSSPDSMPPLLPTLQGSGAAACTSPAVRERPTGTKAGVGNTLPTKV